MGDTAIQLEAHRTATAFGTPTIIVNFLLVRLWEYEVEKAGSPRLRKLYLGFVAGWGSYVVTCTAPAQDWKLWQPVFVQFLKDVQL